jgi:uncharacterized protein (DUF427 family)
MFLSWSERIMLPAALIKPIAATTASVPENKSPKNAVWTYDGPFPAVAQIEGHLAFYAERVDEKTEEW